MNNPPDPRPVYEYDQIVTIYDIQAIRNGYIYQYNDMPWHAFSRRLMFRVGVGVCNEILRWVAHGKPEGGVKCKGGHNG